MAAEAKGHLKAVNLHKQSGRHESVAAGCVFVALRTHGHNVALKGREFKNLFNFLILLF